MLYNQGNGIFGAAQESKVGVPTSFQLSIGDLNGDGAPDIISEDITTSISVLTNGTTGHTAAVLARLGLANHFDDVFDIVAAELEPKPSPATYARFLKAHAVDAARAAMFEDLARNLEVPHALGMTTVLVVPAGAREVLREDWELAGRDA